MKIPCLELIGLQLTGTHYICFSLAVIHQYEGLDHNDQWHFKWQNENSE